MEKALRITTLPPFVILLLRLTGSMRCGSNAGVDAPLDHLNRSIQPGLDLRAGDVEAPCRLISGKTLLQAQLDNLAVGLREA